MSCYSPPAGVAYRGAPAGFGLKGSHEKEDQEFHTEITETTEIKEYLVRNSEISVISV